ncbi:LysR family transcriptional regulator [Loktanella sp. Alg231-35]|uniref:LysR family transcriptional regulator n=1 Tax=Loktanella sp. Alg231-35 TaxID=1922220 RepID=UPI000D55E3D0|nr:LysR family transcriptional regulator [Loktanella sp. Alg231-35]
MNLQELRTFLTIIETGSLVRASEVLNVTQSTVTARLKSLEDELGQTLLIRNKSGATQTAAGVKLRRYANSISTLWQQARQDVAIPMGTAGFCNFACEYDLWGGLGEVFVQRLTALCPEVHLSIWLGSQSEVMRWLDEGKSDVAFTYRPGQTPQHGKMALQPDQLMLVSTSPDSPIRFDPDYVFVEAGERFERDHTLAFADAGTARVSISNAAIGLDHLLRYGGSAYLPARVAGGALAAGDLFHLTDAPQFDRAIYVMFDKGKLEGWQWFDDALAQFLPSV